MRRKLPLLVCSAVGVFAQTPSVTAVLNAFNYSATLCPGLLVNVYGKNFGTDSTKASVVIGGKDAFILGGSSFLNTQFAVEIPMELSPGPTTMTVTINGTALSPINITLAAVSPAINSLDTSGTGLGVVFPANSNKPLSLSSPGTPGELLTVYAVGLGATTPPTPTGITMAANPVVPTPMVTIGGVQCQVLAAVTAPGQAGFYQINFKAPASGVQGTEPLVITLDGVSSSNKLTIPLVGLSAVTVNGSFANPGTIAPGSIASVFANGLGSASTNELSALFPATSSEQVQVTFNGEPAPMFHLIPGGSPQQIDLLIPADLPTSGAVNVQLTTSSNLYPNYTLNMVPASPSMFRFTDAKNCPMGPASCAQYAIVQFVNTAWLVLPTAAASDIGFPVCDANTNIATECGEPATIGDTLVIYMTGLGLATPNGDPKGTPLPAGMIPPVSGSPLYETPTMPAVTIGGIAATPIFSGLVPGDAGEYEVIVKVPAGVTNGDSVPVEVTMMGVSDTANISIQPGRVPPP